MVISRLTLAAGDGGVMADAIVFAVAAFTLALATGGAGVMANAVVFAMAAFAMTTAVVHRDPSSRVAVSARRPLFGPRFSILLRPITLLAPRVPEIERLLMPWWMAPLCMPPRLPPMRMPEGPRPLAWLVLLEMS